LIKNHIFFSFLLLCIGFAANAFANDDSWLNKASTYPWLDDNVYQLPSQLVIPVAQSELQKAIEMLNDKKIVKLNLHTASKLINVKVVSPDDLVLKAYYEAEQKAKSKEKEAKDPFFAGDAAKRMQKEANDYHRSAVYTKALRGKLKAYLVRALVLNKETGGFSVYSKDSELWIYHHSLGNDVVSMKKSAVILFLEKQPTKIYIDAGMAQ